MAGPVAALAVEPGLADASAAALVAEPVTAPVVRVVPSAAAAVVAALAAGAELTLLEVDSAAAEPGPQAFAVAEPVAEAEVATMASLAQFESPAAEPAEAAAVSPRAGFEPAKARPFVAADY